MATIKHLASKNSDYGAAEEYLRYQHDELTGKTVRREDGTLISRKDTLIETLNCGTEDFAVSCLKANLRYGKNRNRDEIKSHHYIISFDPADREENGLTAEKAMELGKEFCLRNFEGHQAILGVHPDGHNGTGNIHVHIIINSLRTGTAQKKAYMDRNCDTLPGYKHRCTAATFRHFRKEVMELCEREGLRQIDLLSGKGRKVTDREYQAARSGQRKLEERNQIRKLVGCPVKETRFETEKEKIRQILHTALSYAVSMEDLQDKLRMEGLELKESRGRFTYLPAGRNKAISARRLGSEFDRKAVLACLEQNRSALTADAASGKAEKPMDSSLKSGFHLQAVYFKQVSENRSLGRIIDPDRGKEKGAAYSRWIRLHNLKILSEAVLRYGNYGFTSPEQFEKALTAALQGDRSTYRELVQIRAILEKSGFKIRETEKNINRERKGSSR